MAEAAVDGSTQSESNKSFSMRMAIYGICKKFPSVRNISCDQLEKWRQDKDDKLVILVSLAYRQHGLGTGSECWSRDN